MSFPLHELRGILSPSKSFLGRVVSLSGSRARVATVDGWKDALVSDTITIGDRVVLTDGVASKAPTPKITVLV